MLDKLHRCVTFYILLPARLAYQLVFNVARNTIIKPKDTGQQKIKTATIRRLAVNAPC
jgi:hypothetical protein